MQGTGLGQAKIIAALEASVGACPLSLHGKVTADISVQFPPSSSNLEAINFVVFRKKLEKHVEGISPLLRGK